MLVCVLGVLEWWDELCSEIMADCDLRFWR